VDDSKGRTGAEIPLVFSASKIHITPEAIAKSGRLLK
jgi:hypothetical protein